MGEPSPRNSGSVGGRKHMGRVGEEEKTSSGEAREWSYGGPHEGSLPCRLGEEGIDMHLFPDNMECRTSGFRCVEMQENRHGTFQAKTEALLQAPAAMGKGQKQLHRHQNTVTRMVKAVNRMLECLHYILSGTFCSSKVSAKLTMLGGRHPPKLLLATTNTLAELPPKVAGSTIGRERTTVGERANKSVVTEIKLIKECKVGHTLREENATKAVAIQMDE
ncbi:hypothetical protein L3X38_018228 [Prunus dulcis]|uniref:Uncharacterized protein n=1 Tax=Prunus dulcis TaxID=3755 RepID=A0AAD4WB63_PRUDU|nr:hypothetical protein L3X38_018228 [Prunus dulcis]